MKSSQKETKKKASSKGTKKKQKSMEKTSTVHVKSKKDTGAGKKKMKKEPKKAVKKKPREIQQKTFMVSGKFLMGDRIQKFQKEVEARGQKRAREKIYQDMGSRHRVKRSRIIIQHVEEAP